MKFELRKHAKNILHEKRKQLEILNLFLSGNFKKFQKNIEEN